MQSGSYLGEDDIVRFEDVYGSGAPRDRRARQTAPRIGVVGLGYVGLPLAVAFGRNLDTVGFDINAARVKALCGSVNSTQEMSAADLAAAKRLRLSSDIEDLRGCNTYIVTVRTVTI